MNFSGFPPGGLDFLSGLAADNSKNFFEANRGTYEEALLDPAKAFVADLGSELQDRISPEIRADPRVNGSIFRMNRDIRFSKDKTPYKTHLDMFFWEGQGRSRECPGFFFRLTPSRVILGAGMHRFDAEALEHYRNAVADPKTGAALEQALAASSDSEDVEVGGAHYKRLPAGFATDHERAELLKHNGLYVGLETDVPAEVESAAFVLWCAKRLVPMAPVHRWIVVNVYT